MSHEQEQKLIELLGEARALAQAGHVRDLSEAERIDWVYGNCAIENEAVTRELVADVYTRRARQK